MVTQNDAGAQNAPCSKESLSTSHIYIYIFKLTVRHRDDVVHYERIDGKLHDHLNAMMVEYLQFSFRWMNCLLMRELPLQCTIRLWDTYHAGRKSKQTP